MPVASDPSVGWSALLSVVIADDQPMSAVGLSQVLGEHRFEIAAMVDDTSSAVAAVDAHRPSLLVIEPSMGDPAATLLAIASIVERWSTAVLAFSADISLGPLQAALEHGCLGIVPKTASADEIVRAASAVASRQQYVHQRALAVLVGGLQSDGPDPIPEVRPLTPREMDVLALISGGRTNAAIAEHLGISAATVKSHVENLLRKLEAADRAQAVSTAMRRGLLR